MSDSDDVRSRNSDGEEIRRVDSKADLAEVDLLLLSLSLLENRLLVLDGLDWEEAEDGR
jgi:hypothetical protein